MLEHIHMHPIIVHFPIALFISALGLEILSLIFKNVALHQTSWYNYILGVVAAFAAVISAVIENQSLKHYVFYTHRALGWWTLGAAILSLIPLLIIKKRTGRLFRIIFFIFLIILASLVSLTGYYGGRLTYEYGVGVEE